jgi:molybdopterin-guanine dinucleotide biosynthesis protein A
LDLPISAVVLAGGKAQRMRSDKAFLSYRGKSFVRTITDEMLKISDDVVVVIGKKDASQFATIMDKRVKILNDAYCIENPMGGMLSACDHLRNKYAAFVACDTPMMKAEVIRYVGDRAIGHSAAVPIWGNGDMEPLCSVYNVNETKEAGVQALSKAKIGCRHLLSFMKDVKYVSVEEIKKVDPDLVSLRNINTVHDLQYLE